MLTNRAVSPSSMSSSSASLRETYVTPPSSWSFVPAAEEASISSSNSTATSSSPRNFEWHSSANVPSFGELASERGIVDTQTILKTLLASAALQYSSTAVAMPFEVGKTLLQVQWVPRDARGKVEDHRDLTEDDVISDEDQEESYFAEPGYSDVPRREPPLRPADDRGYVIRGSVLDEGTRPEYIIPVGSADGVWGMIKRVGRWKGEGWIALWKGLLTSCVVDVLSNAIQPFTYNVLQSLIYSRAVPLEPSLMLPMASHVFTGLLLSPLDLVRTRLIVQTSLPRFRNYSGPIDALRQAVANEGGVQGLYFHPQLFLPALLDISTRAAVAFALPGLFPRMLGMNVHTTHPLIWSVTELAGQCAGLLITLPLETARRRLQVQSRGAPPLRACVETRPAPYVGVVDVLWRVLSEERSDLPLPTTATRTPSAREKGKVKATSPTGKEELEDGGWLSRSGIGQLYRGLGLRVSASVLVFLLAMVSGDERDSGWTEL